MPFLVKTSNRKVRKDLRKAHQEKPLYSLQCLLWLKNLTAKYAKIYAKHAKKNPYMLFNAFFGYKPNRKVRKDLRKARQEKPLYALQCLLWLQT
jgi:mRNA-degrading endonuclease RelE of RelBE toxin-antitoxin system